MEQRTPSIDLDLAQRASETKECPFDEGKASDGEHGQEDKIPPGHLLWLWVWIGDIRLAGRVRGWGRVLGGRERILDLFLLELVKLVAHVIARIMVAVAVSLIVLSFAGSVIRVVQVSLIVHGLQMLVTMG
jgi:hypothetical protein